MNLEPYYDLILTTGWIVVGLAGVTGVIGLVSIYHDEMEKRRNRSVPLDRRVGPADRRAHAEPR